MTYKRKEQIGDATLYLGDCLEILPTLEPVDAVVTDPPYGIVNSWTPQNRPQGKRTLSWEWDQEVGVRDCVQRAILLGANGAGSAFVFCGYDTVAGCQESLREAGLIPKPFVWVKQCPPPPAPGNWWPSGFEIGLYAYRSGAWFGDADPGRRNVFYGDSLRAGNNEKSGHPTQKPEVLMRHIVASLVSPGGAAIDPFMGSGTTGVACANLQRKFIGIEIEPKYFDIACERIDNAYRQGQLFAAGGST